jgi:hypothetical protein
LVVIGWLTTADPPSSLAARAGKEVVIIDITSRPAIAFLIVISFSFDNL